MMNKEVGPTYAPRDVCRSSVVRVETPGQRQLFASSAYLNSSSQTKCSVTISIIIIIIIIVSNNSNSNIQVRCGTFRRSARNPETEMYPQLARSQRRNKSKQGPAVTGNRALQRLTAVMPNIDQTSTNNNYRQTDRRTDGRTTYVYSALHSISHAAANALEKTSDKVEVSKARLEDTRTLK